jgi:hypothetical protein
MFKCPQYDEIRSRLRSRLLKEPGFLSSVIQENSPLVCEFMSEF